MLWIWPHFTILVIFPGGIKEANKAVVKYLAYKPVWIVLLVTLTVAPLRHSLITPAVYSDAAGTVETGSSLLWNKMWLTCQHSCAWKTQGREKRYLSSNVSQYLRKTINCNCGTYAMWHQGQHLREVLALSHMGRGL